MFMTSLLIDLFVKRTGWFVRRASKLTILIDHFCFLWCSTNQPSHIADFVCECYTALCACVCWAAVWKGNFLSACSKKRGNPHSLISTAKVYLSKTRRVSLKKFSAIIVYNFQDLLLYDHFGGPEKGRLFCLALFSQLRNVLHERNHNASWMSFGMIVTRLTRSAQIGVLQPNQVRFAGLLQGHHLRATVSGWRAVLVANCFREPCWPSGGELFFLSAIWSTWVLIRKCLTDA